MTALGRFLLGPMSDGSRSSLHPKPLAHDTRPRQCDRAARKGRFVDRRCAVIARSDRVAASCCKVVAASNDAVARGHVVVPRIDDAFFPGELGGCSERRHRCAKGRVSRCERRTRRPHRCGRGSSEGMPYLRTTLVQFRTTTACLGGTAASFGRTGARRGGMQASPRTCRVR